MPNTNGAILTEVKATKTGEVIEEELVPYNSAFDVVVEAEAGKNVLNAESSFKVQMVLTDLTAGANVAVKTISGQIGKANWPNQAHQHRFPIPAPGAGMEDHVLRAFAVLQVGHGDPIIDFEQGEIFVVTHP